MANCPHCRTETLYPNQTACYFCGRILTAAPAERVAAAVDTLERGKSGRRRKVTSPDTPPDFGD